jgi:hypothetical protein
MNRWILLMKYDEVKAQKQNYLVFHQKVSLRRNFPGAILQGSLFIPTLPPLATPQCQTKLNPLSTSLIFHGLMEICAPIRIDRIA